ncbi:MAG: hypothetical protein LUF78_09300 [Clostridiales bacterium]|nr:hypothetical protein [Clostridiales bacterium]
MQKENILTRLYFHCKDSGGVPDSEDAKEALEFLYECLEVNGLQKSDYENQVLALVSAFEQQGFINGFKYAVQIFLCCSEKDGS